MRWGNPLRTIGFRIELGKLIAFSVVLIALIYLYPKGYFLYLFLGIIFLIGIFSFIFYSLVDLNEKKKYHPEQIRYLKLMVIIFFVFALLSLLVSMYARYVGFAGLPEGMYVYDTLIIMFVCLVISVSAYSGLRQTGNKLFNSNSAEIAA